MLCFVQFAVPAQYYILYYVLFESEYLRAVLLLLTNLGMYNGIQK